MERKRTVAGSDVVLVKIRPSNQLKLAAKSVELEPLYDNPSSLVSGFGVDAAPQWYLARLPEGGNTPWDQAHTRVADQLGIDESDVLFAEPDLVHSVYNDNPSPTDAATPFAIGQNCDPIPQDGKNRKAIGDGFAWHLGSNFSQLDNASASVQFSDPKRTRIAHLDTGYYPAHETTPEHILNKLERNFVDKDGNPSSAIDPDNKILILDNSGHGTGTIGILAGGPVSANGNRVLGGAPDAAIVPIRVADSVVLLRTSALARALRYAAEIGCHVATLSMGGVPTKAWGEAVDLAYDSGLCICAAAGNHYMALPPRKLVYPARYDRVIAVCGVMANGNPYADLKGMTMEGSFGPKSAMKFAIAAYSPNIPWAVFGCEKSVRLNGEGTSSATPQVAAAAALWIEKYKNVLPQDWRRVEAVRHALFSSAKTKSDRKHFGNGILQARKALNVKPLQSPKKTKRSDSSFAFLRVLTGLGINQPTAREEMYNIELAQRWLLDEELQEIVPDPEAASDLPEKQILKFMDAVIEDDKASIALRKHVISRYPVAGGRSVPTSKGLKKIRPDLPPVSADDPEILEPPCRRIRVYATDPSQSNQLETADTNEVTLSIRWEKITKGPKGEYLEIVDKGPRNYSPVNLNNNNLLAQDGWTPSEGNPQFHQQMVYAVAMKTIEHFERALGRPVLWRPRPNPKDPDDDFVRRLIVRPHALQRANAFYSPTKVELLFGFFEAPAAPGYNMQGTPVYTCLSHDIIAHETTHAILDGMHQRFNEATNPDVLAFHEAFSDIVALLQHFTIPEILEREIAKTRGDLELESMLGKLAMQFGRAAGGRMALRTAIGTMEDGVWKRLKPNPGELARKLTPHARGAILVGAVFDALIAIYKQRIADLLRIYTGGTGVLPSGAIHPDLVKRLAGEAAKSANHVLEMCIRALDYLPPVDVTFFEFLRALITADFEFASDDQNNYRVAFVEAFSRRAIFPGDHDEQEHDGSRSLSPDTLRWQGFNKYKINPKDRGMILNKYENMIDELKKYADACLYINDRKALFLKTREHKDILFKQLKSAFEEVPEFAEFLGLDSTRDFKVQALRRAMRVRLDGRSASQIFVALTQSENVEGIPGLPDHKLRGGSTIVVDLSKPSVPSYQIRKSIKTESRRAAASRFVSQIEADALTRLFFSTDRPEPFAVLHELADEGAQ